MIKIENGDATMVTKAQIIAHIVNDAGRWGAGFSGALEKQYPGVGNDYQNQLSDMKTRRNKVLGFCLVSRSNKFPNIRIVHMIAQHGVRSKDNPTPIDYNALRSCLSTLGAAAMRSEIASIQMPKIGAGLAGGDWSIILPIITSELGNLQIPVTIYEL